MGAGHLSIRKLLQSQTMYIDRHTNKHKCNFTKTCILKVISTENVINYYNILKCNQCLSFTSIKEKGNIQGHIFTKLSKEQQSLPIITGHSKHYYNISFNLLTNISYKEKN